MNAIGTENSRPSSAAQCVAYVAVAELSVGQWNDLIPMLVENVVNAQSTELKKEATLEAIGNKLYSFFFSHLLLLTIYVMIIIFLTKKLPS